VSHRWSKEWQDAVYPFAAQHQFAGLCRAAWPLLQFPPLIPQYGRGPSCQVGPGVSRHGAGTVIMQ
jgi:hypothetical protein